MTGASAPSAPKSATIVLMIEILSSTLMTLKDGKGTLKDGNRTLKDGNYGIFLITGYAGFISSTVA